MTGDRRKFIRQNEDQRRSALISAAVALISEDGPSAATVRAIADRAGVTPGLIRHYFASKEALTRAAYTEVMGGMAEASLKVMATAPDSAEARLAVFVASSLRPPVVDPKAMGFWAGFLHQMRKDDEMRAVHEANYLNYRDLLEGLIKQLPRQASAEQYRADAIACNAVIDGLWLEGCALPEAFAKDELVTIGLRAVGAILGIDLLSHLSDERPET